MWILFYIYIGWSVQKTEIARFETSTACEQFSKTAPKFSGSLNYYVCSKEPTHD